MTVPPRRVVHETRAERALPLPASLVDVAELLDTVRGELHAADRPLADAVIRGELGALVVGYLVAEQPPVTEPAKVVGFQ